MSRSRIPVKVVIDDLVAILKVRTYPASTSVATTVINPLSQGQIRTRNSLSGRHTNNAHFALVAAVNHFDVVAFAAGLRFSKRYRVVFGILGKDRPSVFLSGVPVDRVMTFGALAEIFAPTSLRMFLNSLMSCSMCSRRRGNVEVGRIVAAGSMAKSFQQSYLSA